MKPWSLILGCITGMLTLPVIITIIYLIRWLPYPTWNFLISDCQYIYDNCGRPLPDITQLNPDAPLSPETATTILNAAKTYDLNPVIIMAANIFLNHPPHEPQATVQTIRRVRSLLTPLPKSQLGPLASSVYRKMSVRTSNNQTFTYKYPANLNLASVTLNTIVGFSSSNPQAFALNIQKLQSFLIPLQP